MARTPPPDAPRPDRWLVSTSPYRTLVARRGRDGAIELVKLIERGSFADAEREAELGAALAGPGLVRYGTARRDAATGKPAVVMDLVEGDDLGAWLEVHGPMPPRRAAAVARAAATVLARCHGLGYAHLDVKPANLLLPGGEQHSVVLTDLEHARPLADAAAQRGFTGGSRGYAPPEAEDGAAPGSGFDVFGLAMTLRTLLTGCPPPSGENRLRSWLRATRGDAMMLRCAPEPLRRAIAHGSAAVAKRASLDRLAAALDSYLDAPGDGETELLDRAQRDVFTGTLADEVAGELRRIGSGGGDRDRARALLELREQQRRLLERHPRPNHVVEVLATRELARAMAVAGPRAATLLRRLPSCPELLADRENLLRLSPRLLDEVPKTVAELNRAAEFARAVELCDDADRALAAVRRLGRIPLHGVQDPTPALRDPERLFAATRQELDRAGGSHDAKIRELERAEAELDLVRGAEIVDQIAAARGGANRVAAELKDRVHRLEFYLGSIAQMRPLVDELEGQLQAADTTADLAPLSRFIARCRSLTTSDEPKSSLSQQTLRRSLRDLLTQFPHLQMTAGVARAALDGALEALTREAWKLLADARTKLATPPIPIRPLQAIVHRIDGLRMLDLLIDLDDRPRAELLDELEDVRMELERARAARDRIARGAREAMERGHLTTALFDMERSLDQFSDEADPRTSGPGLAEQFEEAKRRKRAVEESLQRNHALADRYAQLADGPRTERVAVLHERAEVLAFLCENMGKQHAENFAHDLHAVQFEQAREVAAEGEDQLAAATDARSRQAIVERTLSALREHAPDLGWPAEQAIELQGLIERWEGALHASAPRSRRTRARPRIARAASLAAVAIAVAVGGFFWIRHEIDAAVKLDAVLAPALTELAGADPKAERDRFDQALNSCLEQIAVHAPARAAKAAAALAHALVRDRQRLPDRLDAYRVAIEDADPRMKPGLQQFEAAVQGVAAKW